MNRDFTKQRAIARMKMTTVPRLTGNACGIPEVAPRIRPEDSRPLDLPHRRRTRCAQRLQSLFSLSREDQLGQFRLSDFWDPWCWRGSVGRKGSGRLRPVNWVRWSVSTGCRRRANAARQKRLSFTTN